MAVIDWKGAKWEAAHNSLSIPDLLTILKGFGSMELLRFHKPGCSKGEVSLCLTDDGSKEITLYHLEVYGPKRQGRGRETLRWLKQIFKGAIFLEFPDQPSEGCAFDPSMPFWLRMYREGLIDALDCETFYLSPLSSEAEVQSIEQEVRSAMDSKPAAKTR
ncbi:MAG: hypothetical protein WAW37_10810 [Syntrophobacteraceae bacterium]